MPSLRCLRLQISLVLWSEAAKLNVGGIRPAMLTPPVLSSCESPARLTTQVPRFRRNRQSTCHHIRKRGRTGSGSTFGIIKSKSKWLSSHCLYFCIRPRRSSALANGSLCSTVFFIGSVTCHYALGNNDGLGEACSMCQEPGVYDGSRERCTVQRAR